MSSPYRVVTASSLFDGHDASINVFRRLLLKAGLEVVHLGHNRGVDTIVEAAVQEDADAICVSSYQGGHMEFFKYMHDKLQERGAGDIALFGGGGGTITPSEIEELHHYGVTRLYHAEDGMTLGGPEGIIQDMLALIDRSPLKEEEYASLVHRVSEGYTMNTRELAQLITLVEEETLHPSIREKLLHYCKGAPRTPPIIGITGPGGAGKSSLVDELIRRYIATTQGSIGVIAVDPTKRKTGGALLGDRIRMNAIDHPRVFMRSMATRGSEKELSSAVLNTLNLMKQYPFDLILLETSGIGQGDTGIVDLSDLALYVMTNEYGASTQLEKIDMIDYADYVVINKFDKMGSEDALNDVLYAYAHSRNEKLTPDNRDIFPVFGTTASSFNDPGVTALYTRLMEDLQTKQLFTSDVVTAQFPHSNHAFKVIPAERSHYLGGIAATVRGYHDKTEHLAGIANRLHALKQLSADYPVLDKEAKVLQEQLGEHFDLINQYHERCQQYKEEHFSYTVRGKVLERSLISETLAGTPIPKIAAPTATQWGEIIRFMRGENFPGCFPYTSGVFYLKNEEEEPQRQFAGAGGPQQTNERFHYLSEHQTHKRLSTAFDSVTLYGEDPAERPDIWGKIGNSGVSIATLDHMKKLYDGFDLADPKTSVSLTINGPAPIILAMFLNTAIDFEYDKSGGQYSDVKKAVLNRVRGTVQADILKEEQAQNTCIFSAPFAMKMMGDIQQYFIDKEVRNFYSVSISGYHIAEAGANPITQLAFTLANGFTYVEYYLSRGMDINTFAPRLSYFFSCGLDPEYSVMGQVARKIWAIALKERYGADERACKLKYHIQTSGRSLHAQEIAFNDIRTTLQALYAVYDNCNSLHTNAYDEAITTPTEESVRRAMAIQLIINREFGLAKCYNTTQGSYLYAELSALVEEAVLSEFEAISRRGGVLGAMEKQYQRHQIQTESMKYELQKASGELPLIGVNTFLGTESTNFEEITLMRASEEEKREQLRSTEAFIKKAGEKNKSALKSLKRVALSGENIFEELMETVKYASLGQITHLLYTCGGEYRRSM